MLLRGTHVPHHKMPLHFGAWEALGCHGLPWDALRLLMEEVKFEKGDDQKKVDTMVKRVIQMFMEATGCSRNPWIKFSSCDCSKSTSLVSQCVAQFWHITIFLRHSDAM